MKFWNIQIGQLDPHFRNNYIYFGKIYQLLVVDMIYLNCRKNIFLFTTKFQWWWYIITHVKDQPWIPLELSSFRKTISKLESNFSPRVCLCLTTLFELWGEGFVTFFIPYFLTWSWTMTLFHSSSKQVMCMSTWFTFIEMKSSLFEGRLVFIISIVDCEK